MKDLQTNVVLPLRRGTARGSQGLVFRLYTSNPFYVISADLVFVGLHVVQHPRADLRDLEP